MLRKLLYSAAACTAAVAFSGCGGGGSSTSNGGQGVGGNATSAMYLTSDPDPNYEHVWVTVTNMALVTAGGRSVTVYDGSATGGQVVDLSSLNAAGSQNYMLLTGFSASAGPYTGARMTVASSASLVASGSGTATSYTFAGAAGGSTVLTTKFSSPVTVSSSSGMAIDFNLGNWSTSGTTITAKGSQYIGLGSTTRLNVPGCILSNDYLGVVSNLSGTAATQTFMLSRGRFAVNVATSSSTALYNSDGSANPTLTNGEAVDVAGTFDSTTMTLNATAIIIEIAPTPPTVRVNGLVTADSQTANTVTMQINFCNGFMPMLTSLTVNVDPSTVFFDSSGVTDTEAQFYSSLTTGTSMVQVEGTISGSVMTASAIQVLPSGTSDDHLVAARGTVSNISTTNDTFSLTIDRWEGRHIHKGATISVVTDSNTQFAVNGVVQTAASFFATLPEGSTVNVRGTYDTTTSTLTAAIVTQGSADTGPFHF